MANGLDAAYSAVEARFLTPVRRAQEDRARGQRSTSDPHPDGAVEEAETTDLTDRSDVAMAHDGISAIVGNCSHCSCIDR